MKDRYIVLIVVICGTPILLGIGYGIHKLFNPTIPITTSSTTAKAIPDDFCSVDDDCLLTEKCYKEKCVSSCSKKTCGLNEGCKINNHHTSSCQCLPSAYRHNITDQCILKYQWVNYTTELWNKTQLVAISQLRRDSSAVTRVIYGNGDKLPCEGRTWLDKKTIDPVAPPLRNYTKVEVLLIKFGEAKWIPSFNGTVKSNAIEGGNIGNEIVYICRIYRLKIFMAGVMQPSKRSCYVKLLFNNYDTYELLVHKM